MLKAHTSRILPPERGLVNHRRPDGRKCPRFRQVVLVKAHARIPHEADATQLGVELGLGEEALRFAGEFGEDERLAGDGRDLRWKGVSREGEHEQSRAWR